MTVEEVVVMMTMTRGFERVELATHHSRRSTSGARCSLDLPTDVGPAQAVAQLTGWLAGWRRTKSIWTW